MSEMATEQWCPEPALCRSCGCSWHGLPCATCFCETSCLAPILIIPAHIELGEN